MPYQFDPGQSINPGDLFESIIEISCYEQLVNFTAIASDFTKPFWLNQGDFSLLLAGSWPRKSLDANFILLHLKTGKIYPKRISEIMYFKIHSAK